MKDIVFRHYSQKDHISILKLINSVQPNQPWSKEHFQWQYLDNPAGNAKVWVAESEGNIVASYAAVPHYFKIRDAEGIAWMVQDVLTHPEFRGRGIMHKLAILCNEVICNNGFPLKYTFPNERSHNSFIRRGWTEAFRVPLRLMTDLPSKVKKDDCDFNSISAVSLSGNEVEDLWNATKNDFPFAVSRTSRYLTWRYSNRPDAKYFPFGHGKGGVMGGLLIMKYYKLDKTHLIAHICDLFVRPGSISALKGLLMKAVKFAVDGGASELTCWLPPGHVYEPLYDAAGFKLKDDITRWVIVRLEDGMPQTAGANEPQNWHLAMGDSDVY